MTNLELLLRCDSELRQYVVEFISDNYCLDPKKMKIQNYTIKCEKCPFSIRNREETDYLNCNEAMENWLIQDRGNISELAFIDTGTGTIVGGGPDE